ncbi:MAG TPA: laccase domain-containing protein [Candidatus Saccharimonadales bacterium]|jgi:copper oxidase (laccase) domain-containing protein
MKNPRIFVSTGVKLAISTKQDGHTSFSKISDGETEDNINRFVDGLDWNDSSRAFMRITYGKDRTYDDIVVIDGKNKPPRKFAKIHAFNVDSLATNLTGVALLLPTADCYPVVMFDPKNKALSLNHIGWHSTTSYLLEKTIKRMNDEFGSKPSDLLVYIGPGIPAEHYVFEEPAQLKMPGWKPYLKRTTSSWSIDLLGYNLNQLNEAGIKPNNIEQDLRNTIDGEELESNYVHNQLGLSVAKRFLTAVMLG